MPDLTEQLLSMPQKQFQKEIVEPDLRGQLDDRTAVALRTPKVVDRWAATLVWMNRKNDGVLASRKSQIAAKRAELLAQGAKGREAWLAESATYEQSRVSTLRFKDTLEGALREARDLQLRYSTPGYVASREGRRARQDLDDVLELVRQHRDTFPEDDEPSDTDRALWALLDGRRR